MKYLSIFLFIIVLISCDSEQEVAKNFRTDFSQPEKEILSASRKIIKDCYFGTLINIDQNGQPRARAMEVFAPENDFTIWMATNPKSRKVNQILQNSKATMHYFDKNNLGYVSLMGNAFIINDNAIKAEKWKDGWEQFYQNREEDYLLIKFVPENLELISIPNGFTGDDNTWQPHRVILRN